ncbi:MAG: T9SS type A sorting domain-containing protein [Bacteroidetes bacterium]|nr:T9SS type A sorting domain-containing protein [Bacteroidota bacterium]
MKKNLILLLFLSNLSLVYSQERLVPLLSNPFVGKHTKGSMKDKPSKGSALALPFIDDFSEPTSTPDASRWMDNNVYVNNHLAAFPPSQGVATFDALNDTGGIYSNAASFPFIADYLTSRFIDLGSYAPSDSIYFSFSYQPGGLANNPEAQDSLILQFLEQYRADTLIDTTVTPHDTTFTDKWKSVWNARGMDVDTFHQENRHWFGQVMIPIKDPVFLRNDFQFRFYNYASLGSPSIPSWRSDADFWNLDYVYLNSNRTLKDTLFNDITFVNTASSLLKNYYSMTLRQYRANPAALTRDSIHMLISNLGKDTYPYHYRIYIKELTGADLDTTIECGFLNINPFYSSGYQSDHAHEWPKFPKLTFHTQQTDSAVFSVTHVIDRNPLPQDFIGWNDTLRFFQRFYNYMAYDDGSAEAGYGLSPAGSMLAVHFNLYTQDTLVGVQMYFNRTLGNSNVKNFKLCIWGEKNGVPDSVMYISKTYLKPVFEDSLNKFHTYPLTTVNPLVLDSKHLSFFVGWIQQTDDNLNIGFDANNNAQSNTWFNIDGNWQMTQFTGALMIRPVLGDTAGLHKGTTKTDPTSRLTIYPNPTLGHFTIELPQAYPGYEAPSQYELTVFDMIGKKIAEYPYLQDYDLSHLPRGIYILQLHTTDHYLNFQGKLVITK